MFFTSALKNEAVHSSITLAHTYDTSTLNHNLQDNNMNFEGCLTVYRPHEII